MAERMRKELRRLKVINNKEDMWNRSKEYKTNQVSDRRSRYNNWRKYLETNGYKHSEFTRGCWKNGNTPKSLNYVKDSQNIN